MKTEFKRAPAAVNTLIAISQARGQDPGILLPDAFVWVAKTQLALTPGLAARSIEVLCSVFDPKLGYNVFEAVGDLYKCVPTPKAGVILNTNNLSRAHESVLKVCGPPCPEV